MNAEDDIDRPSKSERKRRSDDLQALGEALIGLSDSELDALPLPETLRDAVLLARRITAHGGLYRQKQYIGKLMRKIDAEPIRAALEARRGQERLEALRFRRIEHWRDRLVQEGAPALAQLRAEVPGIDTAAQAKGPADGPSDVLAELVERARRERQSGGPAHASRELFRLLRDLLATMTP